MSKPLAHQESSSGLECVVKAEVCDLLSEVDTHLAGPTVVDAAPEPRADDLLAELGCRVEVVHGIEVSGSSGGVEAADVEVY